MNLIKTVFINPLKTIVQTLLTVSLVVFALLLSSGCDEKSFGPKKEASENQNTEQSTAPAQNANTEPTINIGGVQLPMPVPEGLKRVGHDSQLIKLAQTTLGSNETVLCLFVKSDGGSEPNIESAFQKSFVRVSTLNKWINAQIPSLEFLKVAEPWQEKSIVFNQNTLTYFEEAATTRLKNESSFTYNLGLIDSSPLHVSLLQVVKRSSPETGAEQYTCITTSAMWRQGKVLNITYNRPIQSFDQIQAVVAESIGYLSKILTLDRQS